ncbi:MAG TPA: glycosyltransferase family A protein [Candidatus Binatia bacterium]|jgi:glycosyltransferase involved in cell wall biosynthesis
MELPFIDVVVPTWNRASLLERIILSLMAQTYPADRYLVTVVDDGSTDETWAALQRMAARCDRLKPLHISHAGLSAAKNFGWGRGSGDIVAFTDDDCVADPGWLAAIAEVFAAQPEALGLQGKTLTFPDQVTPMTHQVVARRPNLIYHSCNIAYRRKILSAVGGFDEAAHYAEDMQLAAAVLTRGPIVFAPEMIVIHPPRPRAFMDRAGWNLRLEGFLRLYCRYPDFYRRARGRHFLLTEMVRWGFTSTLKQAAIHLPWLARNPALYVRFLALLLRERATVVAMLPGFWRAHRDWVKGSTGARG